MDSFNTALKGGEDNSELMDKLTTAMPGLKGGAKKRHRRQTRKPRKVRSSKKRPAPTRKKPRRAKSSRRRRSRRGGIWNTLPAVALLAANEGMKRKSGSNLYAKTRRW